MIYEGVQYFESIFHVNIDGMASPSPHALPSGGEIEGLGEREGGAETEEAKEELIGRILELQNTLHDLTQRVNSVKEENTKLKSENEVRAV